MKRPLHLRRAGVALAGAALLLAGAAGANAAGGPQPGTPYKVSPANPSLAVNPAMPTGSEAQFIAVTPCRIIDTRVVGGAVSGQRTFDATLASYAPQGGRAGTCDIPAVATSVQLNLGAISQKNSTSDFRGWAAGTTMPTASLVNFNPSGPAANMVTMPLNASGQFTLRTPGTAHVFADVAGYYVKPLYASIDAETDPELPAVFLGVASGLVSVDTYELNDVVEPGYYTLTFDRNVTKCVPAATDLSFTDTHSISVDATYMGDSTVLVQVKDADGEPSGTMFHVSLTC